MTQEGPKKPPREPQEGHRRPQSEPKRAPREPQDGQRLPRKPQRAPGQPRSPKTTQKCPPRGPRNATNTDVLLVCVDVGKLKSSVSIRSQTEGPRRPQRPRRRAPEAPKTTPTEGIRRDFPRPTAPQRPPKRSLETPTELRQAPKRLQKQSKTLPSTVAGSAKRALDHVCLYCAKRAEQGAWREAPMQSCIYIYIYIYQEMPNLRTCLARRGLREVLRLPPAP